MNNTEQMPLILNSNNTIICLDQAADVFNKYFLILINRRGQIICTLVLLHHSVRALSRGLSKNGSNTISRIRLLCKSDT
jgi:hypothetical protein